MRQLGSRFPLPESRFCNIQYVKAAGEALKHHFPGRPVISRRWPAAEPSQKAVLEKYKKDYETKYQEDVSTFGGHAYDALMILVKTIEIAALTRKSRDAIETSKDLWHRGIFNFRRPITMALISMPLKC